MKQSKLSKLKASDFQDSNIQQVLEELQKTIERKYNEYEYAGERKGLALIYNLPSLFKNSEEARDKLLATKEKGKEWDVNTSIINILSKINKEVFSLPYRNFAKEISDYRQSINHKGIDVSSHSHYLLRTLSEDIFPIDEDTYSEIKNKIQDDSVKSEIAKEARDVLDRLLSSLVLTYINHEIMNHSGHFLKDEYKRKQQYITEGLKKGYLETLLERLHLLSFIDGRDESRQDELKQYVDYHGDEKASYLTSKFVIEEKLPKIIDEILPPKVQEADENKLKDEIIKGWKEWWKKEIYQLKSKQEDNTGNQ